MPLPTALAAANGPRPVGQTAAAMPQPTGSPSASGAPSAPVASAVASAAAGGYHGGVAPQVAWGVQPTNVSVPATPLYVAAGRQFSADLAPGSVMTPQRHGQQPVSAYPAPGQPPAPAAYQAAGRAPVSAYQVPGQYGLIAGAPISYHQAPSGSHGQQSGHFSFLPGMQPGGLLSQTQFQFDVSSAAAATPQAASLDVSQASPAASSSAAGAPQAQGRAQPSAPSREALRDALCEEAFRFVDALQTGYIDFYQNKTGLTMVFQRLGDVPMPKDEWYVRVFQNFVVDEKGLGNFKMFREIVVQWDMHHLRKKQAREACAQDGVPPPPPRNNSMESAGSAPRSAQSAISIGSASSATGTETATSRPASSVPEDRGIGSLNGADRTPLSASGAPLSGRHAEGESAFFQSIPAEAASAAALEQAAPAASPAAAVAPAASPPEASPATRGTAVSASPGSTGDEPSITRGPSRMSTATGRVSAAELTSEVMFPTYVGRLAIFDDYEFFGDVGSGSFGKVMVVRHRQTKQLRACKVVGVQSALQRELIDTEIRLLKSLNHPNIMKMHEVYFEQENSQGRVTNGNIYIVTELCEGGDLFSRILHHYERLKQPMTESHVAFMLKQILSACKYCHDQSIIHRDIKPENILFVDRSSSSPLKIIDFGLANFTEKIREEAREVKIPRSGPMGKLARMLPSVNGRHLIPWHERKKVMQKAGTPHYMAPEMIEGYYDEKADLFSIGIILCQLLTGWHPFYVPGDDEQSVRAKISAQEPVEFPREVWQLVSRDAEDLCRGLLEKCPKKRLSSVAALSHSWVQDPTKPSPYGNVEVLSVSIFEGLMQYQAYNKLKRAVLQLLTRELSEFQIQELRNKFMALDKEGDGLLSPAELVEGMRHVGYEMSNAELDQVLASLDPDSQKIGYKEFVSALIERRVKFDRQQLWDCFKKFDTNNSGRITYEDVKTKLAAGITASEWQEITSVCTNASGSPGGKSELSFEEFVALMEQTEG